MENHGKFMGTYMKNHGKKQKKHNEDLWDWETVEEFHGDVM